MEQIAVRKARSCERYFSNGASERTGYAINTRLSQYLQLALVWNILWPKNMVIVGIGCLHGDCSVEESSSQTMAKSNRADFGVDWIAAVHGECLEFCAVVKGDSILVLGEIDMLTSKAYVVEVQHEQCRASMSRLQTSSASLLPAFCTSSEGHSSLWH